MVNYIPEGHHHVTPYLVVPGVAKLIEFLKQAFGAELVEQPSTRPDGSVMHAQVKIGDSRIMMGEPMGDFTAMPAVLYLYVPNTDATYKKAIEAGAKSIMEPADQFYGDRNAGVEDASGNMWWIATHIEDVSPDEMTKRAEAALKEREAAKS